MANSHIKECNGDMRECFELEVLIRQKPGGPFPPVRLHRYLRSPAVHQNEAELLNRLGRSVVRISADAREDYGGSGFLAKFCLTNDDTFYALVTNEHVIGMELVCSGSGFYIFSELLHVPNDASSGRYLVDLSTCPFALCSPPNFSAEDGMRISRSDYSSLILRNRIAKFEGDGPHLDVTVIELNEKLVNQIGKDNFIAIAAVQQNTSATNGNKIFVLEYPLFTNVAHGTPRELCISAGVVRNDLKDCSNCFFMHTADTQRYASGSPVLRWNGTVCGVHRGGEQRDDAQGRPDDYNLAATMDVVVERLHAARSQNP